MHSYTLAHVRDDVLLRDLAALVAQDRATTASLLAHIAEVDARRLFVPAGYPSMHAYCVEELRLSDDAAYKRIRAARAARRFPILFTAIAEGKLHLAAVSLLAWHLTPENAAELIEAAIHRRKSEIEEMLARRFPSRDVPVKACMIRALGPAAPAPSLACTPELPLAQAQGSQLAPGPVENGAPAPERVEGSPLVPETTGDVRTEAPPTPTPERYLLRLTIEKITLEKLRYIQVLLSHTVPSGDLNKVLDRALDLLIPQLEKQKFGAAAQRPNRHRTSVRRRHVPAQVRRAVWERDQGQCTFVSASGKRCTARKFLEFDHVDPVARGGKATVERMRLRCRAHNQHEADRAFGAEFMARKRQGARLAAARARTRATTDRTSATGSLGVQVLRGEPPPPDAS